MNPEISSSWTPPFYPSFSFPLVPPQGSAAPFSPPSPYTHSNITHNEIPTADQWTAVLYLRGNPIPSVLDWSETVRQGLYPDVPYQHLHALSVLKDCPNDLVHKWLNDALSLGQYPHTMLVLPTLTYGYYSYLQRAAERLWK